MAVVLPLAGSREGACPVVTDVDCGALPVGRARRRSPVPVCGMPYLSWVSSGSGDQAATAAQIVLATSPADDAGAETADRYDWQAAMAAADGLALYHDALSEGKLRADVGARIVCEHHEDWVVIQGDDAELVSGKHREPGYSVFTTAAQLAGDGGLAHMFGRWHTLGERSSCRLVTTAGLRTALHQVTGAFNRKNAGAESQRLCRTAVRRHLRVLVSRLAGPGPEGPEPGSVSGARTPMRVGRVWLPEQVQPGEW
jgi:hypothetical protein